LRGERLVPAAASGPLRDVMADLKAADEDVTPGQLDVPTLDYRLPCHDMAASQGALRTKERSFTCAAAHVT
jgi:hypothetical protein